MSSPFTSRSDGGRHVPLLGAFLAMTLALAAWLAYEAFAAAGSHRETAEAVLGDYTAVALSSFVRTSRAELDDLLDEAFELVDGDLRRGDPIPDPREVLWRLDEATRRAGCRQCEGLRSPVLLFTADPGAGEARVSPASRPPEHALELARRVLDRGTPSPGYEEGLMTLPPGAALPGASVLAYGVARDSAGGGRVVGFVVPEGALRDLFAAWFDARRLLPEPIGGELPNDSLLRVTVRSPAGTTIYRSPVEYETTLSAGRSLGPENADLTVEMAIRPDQASRLIIGGLPSSRLPLLATLLVLTLGIGGAALVQFRREAEFQRLREDFVSGVSHELRTPLAQIRMFAELQDTGRLDSPEDRQRANAVIHREARRLSHLVDNILQFSRLRRGGGREMPREDLDLAGALEEGIDAMSGLFHDRSMTLRFDGEPGLRVRADRDALTRVVVNLLDNAAKYGPEGQRVTVAVRRADGSARLSVEDEGPGVPTGDRRSIWQPYRRLERDVRGPRPGTGIGLSVVSDLTRAHGGRAWVEAAEGGGARFVVELPLAGGGHGAEPREGDAGSADHGGGPERPDDRSPTAKERVGA